MVRVTSRNAVEFACRSKACAPPPAGRGGSIKGVGQGEIKVSRLKAGDRVVFAQKVRTVSSVGAQGNGKIGISFRDGGITDLRPDQTLPRPSKKVRIPAGTARKFITKPDPRHRDERARKAGTAWDINNPPAWVKALPKQRQY